MNEPSVAQMANRSQPGHLRVLRAIAEDQPVGSPLDSAGSLRGLQTCVRTLRRWGCLAENGLGLTDRGRELLTALQEREAKAR